MGCHQHPVVISTVFFSSKHHHQCLHLCVTTQFIYPSFAAYLYIVPCLHRIPLPLCHISDTTAISKNSNHVLLKPNATVSPSLLSTTYVRPLSAPLSLSFLSSYIMFIYIFLSSAATSALIKKFPDIHNLVYPSFHHNISVIP